MSGLISQSSVTITSSLKSPKSEMVLLAKFLILKKAQFVDVLYIGYFKFLRRYTINTTYMHFDYGVYMGTLNCIAMYSIMSIYIRICYMYIVIIGLSHTPLSLFISVFIRIYKYDIYVVYSQYPTHISVYILIG